MKSNTTRVIYGHACLFPMEWDDLQNYHPTTSTYVIMMQHPIKANERGLYFVDALSKLLRTFQYAGMLSNYTRGFRGYWLIDTSCHSVLEFLCEYLCSVSCETFLYHPYSNEYLFCRPKRGQYLKDVEVQYFPWGN